MAKPLHPLEVIRQPLVTEKGTSLQAQHKYIFEVAMEANKAQVKEAVEAAFTVKVVKVNMMVVPGKTKRWGRHRVHTSEWKKAIVTLRPEDKIQIFEGV